MGIEVQTTKFFHAAASARRRSNIIPHIEHQGTVYSDEKAKAECFFQYYVKLMGTQSNDMPVIHWSNLYEPKDLSFLGTPIQEQEIRDVVKQ